MPPAARRQREKERDARKADQASLLPTVIDGSIEPYREILRKRRPGEKLTLPEQEAIRQVVGYCDGNAWRAWGKLKDLVSHDLVWRVAREDEGAFQETRARWKEATARQLQSVADLMVAKIAAKVESEDVGLKDLTISYGILHDKAALAAGDAVTVNHVHRVDERAMLELSERIKSIQLAPPVADALDAEWTVTEVSDS